MEPILLYGHPLGSSMGLVAALEWLAQPYRLSRVDMLRDMRGEDYKRLNGRQETPALVVDGERVVTETMAIARWLETRDRDRRITFAPGTPDSDRMHQFTAFLNTGFTGAFSAYWVALEMATPDPDYQTALRRFGRAQVNARHRKLEEMMSDSPYLVGDRPTLADAVFVGVARWADFHKAIDRSDFPRIAALKERLESDPAVRFATAIENGESPKGSGALQGQVPLRELLLER
jgi:glutathione S-transferase